MEELTVNAGPSRYKAIYHAHLYMKDNELHTFYLSSFLITLPFRFVFYTCGAFVLNIFAWLLFWPLGLLVTFFTIPVLFACLLFPYYRQGLWEGNCPHCGYKIWTSCEYLNCKRCTRRIGIVNGYWREL